MKIQLRLAALLLACLSATGAMAAGLQVPHSDPLNIDNALTTGDVLRATLARQPQQVYQDALHAEARVLQSWGESLVPEVERIVARAGSDEIGLDPMGLNETDSFLVLKPREQWHVASMAELIDKIRAVLDQLPGIAYGFTQPIEMRVSEMLTGVRGDVAVKLYGADLQVLNQKADAIAEVLRTVPGNSDVFTSQNDGMQYLRLRIDRAAVGRLGLNVDQLESILRAQVEGVQLGIVQEGAQRTPLLVRGPASLRDAPDRFAALPIALPDGSLMPLKALAAIERVEGVVSVAREQGQRFVVVRSNVSGRDLVGFVDEARQAVATGVELPTGYYLQWGGQFENQQRAAARLVGGAGLAGTDLSAAVLHLWFGSPGAAGTVQHTLCADRRAGDLYAADPHPVAHPLSTLR